MVRSSDHYIKNIINGKTFHFRNFHHRFNHSSVSFTRYNQTLIFWGSIFHFSIWCFDHFGKLIEKHKWNISHVLLHPVDNFALMRVWSERYCFLIWMSPLLAKLIETNKSIKNTTYDNLVYYTSLPSQLHSGNQVLVPVLESHNFPTLRKNLSVFCFY